jgi:glycosyltransferase involved in cell wall biosynthesis
VVIPARNAGPYILQTLEGLATQDYEGDWEVIVVDNGSDDDTRHIVESSVHLLENLQVIDASQGRGVAFARNRGSEAARGQYLAFCDADDIAAPWWLRSLVSQGRRHSICYGQHAFFRDEPPDPAEFSPEGTDDGLLVDPFGYLPFASGGNLLVHKTVVTQLNGFDEDYGAGEDVDFCWRAQYEGFTLGSARGALIFKRDRESARSQFRQYYGYGKGEVHLYRDHAGHGMPRASLLRAVAVYGWLIAIGVVALARRDPYYRLWVNSAGRRCGRLAGSLHFRRLYL